MDAIDETHIDAQVPKRIVAQFYGRQGKPTQKILMVCSFDIKITYVISGWEAQGYWFMLLLVIKRLNILMIKFYIFNDE